MGSNREIKSDGNINITSTQTNISGDLDVTGSINNFTFPGSDGLTGQTLVTNGAGTLSFADGGAGGGTGKNYIENFRATSDVSGYATYADAAATFPADGTGGSANITFTRNTTTPLRDTADFKITKDAANRQGEGISNDFTIDNADKAKKLIISFDYDASHAGYSDGDIKVYIYDITNTVLIRVNGEDLKAGKSKHYAQFQSASNSTSYRLIFHVSSTNAAAYDVFLDEISVGPQNISHGTIVTDWQSYTPTGSWTGDVTYEGRYRRVGDSLEVEVQLRITGGSIAGGDLTFTSTQLFNGLGLSADTTKLINDSGDLEALGVGLYEDQGSKQRGGITLFYQSTSSIFSLAGPDYSNLTSGGTPITWASGDSVSFRGTIPISGYSSNTKMSEDFSGRDVLLQIEGVAGSQSFANNSTAVVTDFNTPSISTVANMHDGTNFTAPESGYYDIHGQFTLENDPDNDYIRTICEMQVDRKAGAGFVDAKFWRTDEKSSGAEACQPYDINAYYLAKGQQIRFQLYQQNSDGDATTIKTTSGHTWLYISKRHSAQTILENETIAMRVTKDDAQAIPSVSTTKIEYDDIDYDTHGAFNTSTNKYTIPSSGIYDIYAKIRFADLDETPGMNFQIYIMLNGSNKSQISDEASANNTTSRSLQINDTLSLNKGDEIHISIYHGDPDTENTMAQATDMVCTIKKIK